MSETQDKQTDLGSPSHPHQDEEVGVVASPSDEFHTPRAAPNAEPPHVLKTPRLIAAVLSLLSLVFGLVAVSATHSGWAILDNNISEVKAGLLGFEVTTKMLPDVGGDVAVGVTETLDYVDDLCPVTMGGSGAEGCAKCTVFGPMSLGFQALALPAAAFATVVVMDAKTRPTVPLVSSIIATVFFVLGLGLYGGCHKHLQDFQSDSADFDMSYGFGLAVTAAVLSVLAAIVAGAVPRLFKPLGLPQEPTAYPRLRWLRCSIPCGVVTFVLIVAVLVAAIIPTVSYLGIEECAVPAITVVDNGSTTVVLHSGHVYVALGAGGILIQDTSSSSTNTTVLSSVLGLPVVNSIDIDSATGVLFAVSVRTDQFSMASIDASDPTAITLVTGPVTEPMNPSCQVHADSGTMVLSGGTQHVSAYSYTGAGVTKLGDNSFDRGGPAGDLLPGGQRLFLSTHIRDDVYGVTLMTIPGPAASSRRPVVNQMVPLEGSGCTEGFAQPSNWAISTAWAPALDYVFTVHGGGVTAFALDATFANLLAPLTQLSTTTIPDFSPVAVTISGSAFLYVVGAPLGSATANVYELAITPPASPIVTRSWTVAGNPISVVLDGFDLFIANNVANSFVRLAV